MCRRDSRSIMAGLIKNQILKHLSKFTKNLSHDKIHLSTLKGEGELSNLELDENVLMEILELPTWLRLSKATCNRVAIKIQWTRLKTQPICLFLDEIVVVMETCQVPRKPPTTSSLSSFSSGGRYGFAERIIDGMYVSINSVVVNFKAPAFQASIQLSRMIIQSKTPLWQTADLRLTRVKDELRGEVMIFKEAEWQTLRIEANAVDTGQYPPPTPLRLIANQSKTRVVIKKRLADCGIVASKVEFNLDDLLWVLTDSQLKAAIMFSNSLKEIIKRSTEQSKLLAAEKLKKVNESLTVASQITQQKSPAHQSSKASRSQIAMAKLFTKYDVLETSYHVHTGRIDLHLCDDAPQEGSTYKPRVDGGAMAVTLHKMHLDFYPYHQAGQDRTVWKNYDENMAARNSWAQNLLATFKEEVRKVKNVMSTPTSSPSHELYDPSSGTTPVANGGSSHSLYSSTIPSPSDGKNKDITAQQKGALGTKLVESCMVCRLEDFVLHQISTSSDPKRHTPDKFLSSDKKQLLLPPEMSAIHLEFTDYYFPDGINFPVPHANLYIVVNPIRFNLDYITLVWLNAFFLSLAHHVDLPEQEGPKMHVDVRLDALMPRIIFPAENQVLLQPDRPGALQIQASQVMLTNCRIDGKSSYSELGSMLNQYEMARLFRHRDFPNQRGDMVAIPSQFREHFNRDDKACINPAIDHVLSGNYNNSGQVPDILPEEANMGITYYNMSCDSLKRRAEKDIWCLSIDQVWLEFLGSPNSLSRPSPFVESVPMTMWFTTLSKSPPPSQPTQHNHPGSHPYPMHNQYSQSGDQIVQSQICDTNASREELDKDIHMLLKLGEKATIQLNHYQYLFLLRLVDTITKTLDEIDQDTLSILGKRPPNVNISVAMMLKEIKLGLVNPPIPGKLGSNETLENMSNCDLTEAQDLHAQVKAEEELNDTQVRESVIIPSSTGDSRSMVLHIAL